jgi:hypothetical protein
MKNTICFVCAIGSLLLVTQRLPAGDIPDPNAWIDVNDFPMTSSRAMFFEERINSLDNRIRERCLAEVSYFYTKPDQEYVSFLSRMVNDIDPAIRGQAIKYLHSMWIPIDPCALPVVFSGYHKNHLIDRNDDELILNLLNQCKSSGPTAGYAAYVLGLLKATFSIPVLENLSSHENLFVRYAAGRALYDCGRIDSATTVFDEISSEQLALYQTEAPSDEKNAYYATIACRGLIETGGDNYLLGLSRMIELFGYFEISSNPNDQDKAHLIRNELALLTGHFFCTPLDAQTWFAHSTDSSLNMPLQSTS